MTDEGLTVEPQGQSAGGAEDPEDYEGDPMTVLRGLALIAFGLWLSYIAYSTGKVYGSVDMSRPEEAVIHRVLEEKSFWAPRAWLIVSLAKDPDKSVRIDLEPEQFDAYRRGDLIRLYPLLGSGDFITDRQLLAAQPLWRVGYFAFSWHPVAACLSLLYGTLFMIIGILGCQKYLTGLQFHLFVAHEVGKLVFAASIAVAMLIAGWVSIAESLRGGAEYQGVDPRDTRSFVVTGVDVESQFFIRRTYYLIGTLSDDEGEWRLRVRRRELLGAREGDTIEVLPAVGGHSVKTPRSVESSKPIIRIGRHYFTWHIAISFLLILPGVVAAWKCLEIAAVLKRVTRIAILERDD